MGVLPSNWGCLGPDLPYKNAEISGSEKCILVDPGDGFAMENGESNIGVLLTVSSNLCPVISLLFLTLDMVFELFWSEIGYRF